MLRATLVLTATLAAVAAPSSAGDVPRPAARFVISPHGIPNTPGIRVWTSGSDLRRRGDRVRLYYRTERDAFVTIFRIDTDGRVQVLFPRSPDDENYGYGGQTYTVSSYDRGTAFLVDDYPGVGYIFGVASTDPFDYDGIVRDGRWDLRGIGDGRVHGDPRSAMEDLTATLLPSGDQDFDTHLLPYYVDRRYDYPRFVCYDCHTYTPWTYWDPYSAWCRRYTLTVFYDPYYYYPSYWYPSWYYGGTRVVYSQPRGSRYIFKDRLGSSPGVDYRDRRATPQTPAARTPADRGVRATDIGGYGSVPAPRTPGRREAPPLVVGPRSGGEQPQGRDPRGSGDDQPRPADPRRRAGEAGSGGAPAPADNGRRRSDEPGIQIVPRVTDRPAEPGTGRRSPGEDAVAPTPERRAQPGFGDEPRPARPEAATPRLEPRPQVIERARPQPDLKPEPIRPESRPQRDVPAPRDSRPEPRAQPAPRESRPEARPQPAPPRESRPESRPQASPPRESRPQSQPASTPRSGGDEGGRRRP